MAQLATLSTVTLNQFALDFEGNKRRILESVKISKREGSRFRTGPELEICGYNCEDHFYESDTITHSWEVLADLLKHEDCREILMDVGMPVIHNGVTYNCRVILLNGEILLIRPKLIMCDDMNYRETRWFTGWSKKSHVEQYVLPAIIKKINGQTTAPFGDALLQLTDTKIGYEICEELWNPMSTHVEQSLAGADIIVNGSGSHAEIRKAFYALELIKTASSKCGILYAFANLRGCDGERVYLSGCSTVVLNGEVLKLGEQYSLQDVEVLTATFQLEEIQCYKAKLRSRSFVAASVPSYATVQVPWTLSAKTSLNLSLPLQNVQMLSPEEEIARGPALWLWDYLRRSPASGFFLPLSGGVDSSSVAIIVYSMCRLIVDHVSQNKDSVIDDVRKVVGDDQYIPKDARELCGRIFTTCYMGSENSSQMTRDFARSLAEGIGSYHREISITSVCSAFVEETARVLETGKPSFTGTRAENLALQNVQARSRMVFAYMCAQLTPWSRGKSGFLLVLSSANVDEAIRGYFTKYDCSAGDLNPIGGISKTDLKQFVTYAARKFNLPTAEEIVKAPPTAELCPLETNQTDEEDMGMTYEELSYYGKLRKPMGCGPYSMFARLLHLWKDKHEPKTIAEKVKHFYRSYAANRHKMSVLTPSCHMENYSPEDHRHDLRPLFYPLSFTWQFNRIDELLEEATSTCTTESEVD